MSRFESESDYVVQRNKGRQKPKEVWLPIGNRIMDIAYMWDSHDIQHTGEALMLACLVHTKGKTARGTKEVEHIAKMLDDPNQNKSRRR